MAGIRFHCPFCDAKIEADESLGGGAAQCPSCTNNIMIPKPGIESGMEIGGFVVDRLLGVGGMGEVWLADQPSMQRQVALKILPRAITQHPQAVEQFLKEARNTAKLEHQNIVRIFEAGCDNNIHYLATSYISGNSLDKTLRNDGKLAEDEALRITKIVAEALSYAWEHFGILHLDVKPSNIMITDTGKPVLMDMGLSKSIHDEPSLSSAGIIVGTTYYMSPEQAMADEGLDHRGDIYSLGATLYHLVTGKVPFEASSSIAILTMHLSDPIPSASEECQEVSGRCSQLIQRMMAKDPGDRYATWAKLIRDIDSVMAGGFPVAVNFPTGSYLQPSVATQQIMRQRHLDTQPEQVAKFSQPVEEFGMATPEPSEPVPPPSGGDSTVAKPPEPAAPPRKKDKMTSTASAKKLRRASAKTRAARMKKKSTRRSPMVIAIGIMVLIILVLIILIFTRV